jgi:outer membrane protein assembly factor BamE (lipoprotein component of BamABCDE complex)
MITPRPLQNRTMTAHLLTQRSHVQITAIAIAALCLQLSACSTPQVANSKENTGTKITSAATAPLILKTAVKSQNSPRGQS